MSEEWLAFLRSIAKNDKELYDGWIMEWCMWENLYKKYWSIEAIVEYLLSLCNK